MRIIYLGTPEFAVPTLEKLIAWPQGEVVALVTQPDRPAGRGNHVVAPPCKLVAEKHSIEVLQPERLSKSPDIVQRMRDLQADVLVMAAFGQILKPEVLTLAPLGVVNLHGSLLPKYRGAAPINWAIINGETETGNTSMLTDAGVDTGKMLLKQVVPIGPDTTAFDLTTTMSVTGAGLIVDTLDKLAKGTLQATAQDDSQATMAPRLSKEMGQIDWRKSAQDIHNLVRGLKPWPGTWTQRGDLVVKILTTATICGDKPQAPAKPGSVIVDSNHIMVACGPEGKELLELVEVQPANKAKMAAREWVNGARIASGTVLGNS